MGTFIQCDYGNTVLRFQVLSQVVPLDSKILGVMLSQPRYKFLLQTTLSDTLKEILPAT